MVHLISSSEVIVRSTRGLSKLGTLFKNLMVILRDVVICYDGTIRNVSSYSITQFEYGASCGSKLPSEFFVGDHVGMLAATAMFNPAYKVVLDSSPSSNSPLEMMKVLLPNKEILLCGASFRNDLSDRRLILYLNDCGCRGEYCREKAAYVVKNDLSKVCLKDVADEFLIEALLHTIIIFIHRQAIMSFCCNLDNFVSNCIYKLYETLKCTILFDIGYILLSSFSSLLIHVNSD